MAKIKLGAQVKGVFSIPVAVPVIKVAKVEYSALNMVQYGAEGIEVTEAQLSAMRADTDLEAKIAAGLLVIEE